MPTKKSSKKRGFKGKALMRSYAQTPENRKRKPGQVPKPVKKGQRRRGRPPTLAAKIDWDKLREMAKNHCTLEEIASHFGVSRQGLVAQKRFAAEYSKAYHEGKISLRRLQFALAEAGDRTMLIWLGKQWLGQKDRIESEVSGPDGGPVKVQTLNLHALTTVELKDLRGLLKKAGADDVSQLGAEKA